MNKEIIKVITIMNITGVICFLAGLLVIKEVIWFYFIAGIGGILFLNFLIFHNLYIDKELKENERM